jgi:NADH:ubiquinone oxidoreductase subunit F (NADH-binding)
MAQSDLIQKLKQVNLLGRGGAAFPTYLKWQMVLDAPASKKYIVANGSEGEPNVHKDFFILQNYPQVLVDGLKQALATIPGSEGIIYLNKKYYRRFKKPLEKIIAKSAITVFEEKGGYLSGEETVLCEEIEGKLARPRLRPPFPGQKGINGCPTLINNIETFYYVSKIAHDDYEPKRFYTISGDVKKSGVHEMSLDLTIREVLEKTNNWPKKDFFVQAGGGASGEIFLNTELDREVGGSGAVIVYDRQKTDPYLLMYRWAKFFMESNCDKCTPCREGVYRLAEMLHKRMIDQAILNDLFLVMEESSFCALGRSVPTPFRSLIYKIISPEKHG